ncbi:PHP domain-containing protein [Halobaculum sp. CBA1158]|uniref:PHP domain-containing protein n=1 Tax=Halobaculum sp. CBA1158 TaxID=2904243 RepID=UPI001F4289A5|nr:PHP domain-containing protein [Halobaculum sp. CBA1158]UIO99061.1 PHP domain-containing protein [Halobaculum sp. CBA1158]
MEHDYHVHSTYSDGYFIEFMADSAAEAGLSAIGIADHCVVSEDPAEDQYRREMGFNLDVTYERRRDAIEAIRERADVEIFDAVELDYEPHDEAAIASFLEEAEFDYAVGSVHDLEGVNVHVREYFADRSEAERRALVDEYFEKLVALADSELFAIAAHPDLVERNPALRGLATEDHYERAAAAFADSRTVPELNAGRVLDDYGGLHPAPEFLDALADHGVGVAVGTDSHRPESIGPRVERIEAELAERGLEPVRVMDAV